MTEQAELVLCRVEQKVVRCQLEDLKTGAYKL